MHKSTWKFFNSLPAAIRQKTTPALEAKGKLLDEEMYSIFKVVKTKDEVNDLLYKDKYYRIFEDLDYFSTLDGIGLLDKKSAREIYKTLVSQGGIEYAAQKLTAYDDGWKSIKDIVDNRPHL